MAAIQRPALPAPIRSLPRLRGGRVALVAAAGLVIGLALLQVQQFSAVTSRGYEIEELKRERLAQQARNHVLEAEVAHLSSLARVDIEARLRLKMEPPKRVLYITVNEAPPTAQQLPSRFQGPQNESTPQPSEGTSFIERLLDALPF